MAKEISDIKKLPYEIHKYTSYSTSYLPENILEDCPTNQTSRWSSNSNSPPQFLMVKLQRPAIVNQIKFGKYEKTHVCNLRKFKVFGGLEEDHLVLLFEGGLKNDSIPETFKLRHTTDSGDLLPIMYIQIVPLLSWGPSFNFSIWYVELLGQDDPIFIRTSLQDYNMLRELEIIRLCLKHFRQQGYEIAFQALQKQTNVFLEHPAMSNLHKILVTDGDFVKTEQFIDKFVNDGLMDGYLAKQDYKASWVLQKTENVENQPGMRGGHQLIIDSANSIMYLYGGWDGFEDLSDLWSFDIKRNAWSLIHERSECSDGPSPRSCHKMVYDSSNAQIFTLGRYLDGNSRTRECIKSDFYVYDTKTKTWLLICDDTSQVGGPQLIFDHQMCIDISKQTIYVFGGRILTPRSLEDFSNDPHYSGLYSYHIGTNTWTQILVDCGHPTASNPEVLSIKARVTHSMVFHYRYRKLYIFGGQRNKEYTTDFISYDVDTQEIQLVNANTSSNVASSSSSSLSSSSNNLERKSVPPSGFTQRATIDCERDEIYVLSSLSKEKERRELNLNSFWMYSLKTNDWTCVFQSDHSTEHCYSKPKPQTKCSEPCPRYAHQLVYDWNNRIHYLFGGNPGRNTSPQLRLDDFWVLHLDKPSRQQISRHCKYLIRRLEYEEIAKQDSLLALKYLQTKLSDIVDHNDANELKEFHKLATIVFKCETCNDSSQNSLVTSPICPTTSNTITSSDNNLSARPNPYNQCTSRVCFLGGNSPNLKKPRSYPIKCESLSEAPSTISSSPSTSSSISNIMPNDKMLTDEQIDSEQCQLSTGKRQYAIKTQRCLLFNKIVDLLPENMVQPKGNLSDFVLI